MSDLREDIAAIIWSTDTADAVNHKDARAIADTILALVVAAMTSEAAVEAGALAAHRYGLVPHDVPDDIVKQSSHWRAGKTYYLPESLAAITAALAAAGVTKGDDDAR